MAYRTLSLGNALVEIPPSVRVFQVLLPVARVSMHGREDSVAGCVPGILLDGYAGIGDVGYSTLTPY